MTNNKRWPRREFIASATGSVMGLSLTTSAVASGNNQKLKLGLVGCGGRGVGALKNALDADSHSELWAVADVFPTAIDQGLSQLSAYGERVQPAPERRYIGLEAYQKLIDSGVDVVLLTAPPGFRPAHFAAAVAAGKHCFVEKPMAVDATGVRSIIETTRLSVEKKLNVVSGFCWRYCESRRQLFKALHRGAIGKITSYYGTYLTVPVKPMAETTARHPEWSDVEWQVRNWYHYSWLSGDGFVEQCIHTVDKMSWLFQDQPPVAVVATGGRATPSNGSNNFDHLTAVYEYPNQVFATIAQRQASNCFNENADYIQGTLGHAHIGNRVAIFGENPQRFREDNDAMYDQEHRELFAAIRSGNIINDGEIMARSTLIGIMARMSAYSGQRVTWEQALNSKEDLAPEETLKWTDSFKPHDLPVHGQYQLI